MAYCLYARTRLLVVCNCAFEKILPFWLALIVLSTISSTWEYPKFHSHRLLHVYQVMPMCIFTHTWMRAFFKYTTPASPNCYQKTRAYPDMTGEHGAIPCCPYFHSSAAPAVCDVVHLQMLACSLFVCQQITRQAHTHDLCKTSARNCNLALARRKR